MVLINLLQSERQVHLIRTVYELDDKIIKVTTVFHHRKKSICMALF